MTTISKFDAADYLKTTVAITAYLIEALETRDPAYISIALDTIARAESSGASRVRLIEGEQLPD